MSNKNERNKYDSTSSPNTKTSTIHSPNQSQSTNSSTETTTTNDLASEPELIDASEAHEPFSLIRGEAVPLPEELEQNGKPSTEGGTRQQINRSMKETSADFERKFGWRGSGMKRSGVGKGKEGEEGEEGNEGKGRAGSDESGDGKGGQKGGQKI